MAGKKKARFSEASIEALAQEKPVVYKIRNRSGTNTYTGVAKKGQKAFLSPNNDLDSILCLATAGTTNSGASIARKPPNRGIALLVSALFAASPLR